MPDLPFRSCAGGCGRPVYGGRCSECSKKGSKAEHRHLYDAWWRRESKLFLLQNPSCADPYRKHLGAQVTATDTDHKIPHKGDVKLFRDKRNWQSLCKSCHSRKTAAEGGFGNTIR